MSRVLQVLNNNYSFSPQRKKLTPAKGEANFHSEKKIKKCYLQESGTITYLLSVFDDFKDETQNTPNINDFSDKAIVRLLESRAPVSILYRSPNITPQLKDNLRHYLSSIPSNEIVQSNIKYTRQNVSSSSTIPSEEDSGECEAQNFFNRDGLQKFSFELLEQIEGQIRKIAESHFGVEDFYKSLEKTKFQAQKIINKSNNYPTSRDLLEETQLDILLSKPSSSMDAVIKLTGTDLVLWDFKGSTFRNSDRIDAANARLAQLAIDTVNFHRQQDGIHCQDLLQSYLGDCYIQASGGYALEVAQNIQAAINHPSWEYPDITNNMYMAVVPIETVNRLNILAMPSSPYSYNTTALKDIEHQTIPWSFISEDISNIEKQMKKPKKDILEGVITEFPEINAPTVQLRPSSELVSYISDTPYQTITATFNISQSDSFGSWRDFFEHAAYIETSVSEVLRWLDDRIDPLTLSCPDFIKYIGNAGTIVISAREFTNDIQEALRDIFRPYTKSKAPFVFVNGNTHFHLDLGDGSTFHSIDGKHGNSGGLTLASISRKVQIDKPADITTDQYVSYLETSDRLKNLKTIFQGYSEALPESEKLSTIASNLIQISTKQKVKLQDCLARVCLEQYRRVAESNSFSSYSDYYSFIRSLPLSPNLSELLNISFNSFSKIRDTSLKEFKEEVLKAMTLTLYCSQLEKDKINEVRESVVQATNGSEEQQQTSKN